MLCDGKILVQTYGDFKRGRRTTEERLCRNNLIPTQDAVQALTALGYSGTEALQAVKKVEITEGMDSEAVLKAALKHMF